MFHKIKSVTPLPGYALLVHFADGCARQYNMAPLLDQIDAFAPLRTVPGLFEQVRTDPGGYGISWNDDIDLDGSELWENGQPVSSPFDGLLSFADATSLWGLHDSTLRKAVAYRRLVEGVDAQKFGKQWIVTRTAMEREYGPQPSVQGRCSVRWEEAVTSERVQGAAGGGPVALRTEGADGGDAGRGRIPRRRDGDGGELCPEAVGGGPVH